MNRIVVDSSNININNDSNYLINNERLSKLVINVKNCTTNILLMSECLDDVDIEVYVTYANVVFNSACKNLKRLKINVNLNSENSRFELNNSIIATKKCKHEVMVNHNCKKTISMINNNGLTIKNGSIIFDVSSHVLKGSKESVAEQDSKIISLNGNLLNKINPILLIDEFESYAKHAAFIGNFNEEKLFYLMSRGLSKTTSQNLLITGMLVGSLALCYEEKEMIRKKISQEWR